MSTLRTNTLSTQAGTFSVPVERLARANIRAWVNFDGSAVSSALTGVRASFNIAGIADNGVGDYIIQFTEAMPNTNYCVLATMTESNGGNATSGNGVFPQVAGGTAPLITSIRIFVKLHQNATVASDAFRVYVAIIS